MLYLYPANKMENLLMLLSKIQQVSPLPLFSKEVVIVQNAGMQHWLNMSLAEMRGVSMNIDFSLPAQFLWKLLRSLASEGKLAEQSPFEREALSWRIYDLLMHPSIMEDEDFSCVTHYWAGKNTITEGLQANASQANRCYQLSCQLADVYEQYLVFRPEWIDAWCKKNPLDEVDKESFKETEKWQRKLWQLLVKEEAYNPLELLDVALKNIDKKSELLPKRISFFGINAMAPMWLNFIEALGEYTQVHFFHLNPCFDYWGDIRTEKQAISALSQWTQAHDDISVSVGNPLLANLGQQGREFLALLQDIVTVDVQAFDTVEQSQQIQESPETQPTVLASVQNDILHLTDKRNDPQQLVDDSIMITSAHSALREVQGLHDWLLHQFNQDARLSPKDVLVMCPAIENYAPYVNAVFAPGWQEIGEDVPPLPCSIADRVSKDAEPIVAAFVELLQINTSRFEITKIISWLRLPSIHRKFSIENEDIEVITQWLNKANIHWGRDQSHKAEILGNANVTSQFTWQHGLQKLILGMAQSDRDCLVGEHLFLSDIEGTQSTLIGNFMLMLEQLQFLSTALHQTRTPIQWHEFLTKFVNDFFVVEDSLGFSIILNAINDMVTFTEHAMFGKSIPLSVVQEFLNTHFSQPDPGRQFMVGQVTFCSMLPMRSIPFKIVAILGMNDGEYPRQRQPLGFDLMSVSPVKLGDRSRRGDDRYLFLEALISARKSLYLSYQGRSINNNSEREPSIVLKELTQYLNEGYGWRFDGDNDQLRQLPMQPFSKANYLGNLPGFDGKWLNLIRETAQSASLPIVECELPEQLEITVDELVRFFQHPSRWFAQKRLRMNLEIDAQRIDDNEPFVEDSLQSYLFKQSLFEILNDASIPDNQMQHHVDALMLKAKVSGDFPELPTTDRVLSKWVDDTALFSEFVNDKLPTSPREIDIDFTSVVHIDGIERTVKLTSKLNVTNEMSVFFRMSTPKANDFLRMYICQLLVQCVQVSYAQRQLTKNEESELALMSIASSHGFYFDTKRQKAIHYLYRQIEAPIEKLNLLIQLYCDGQSQPLLLNSPLAEKALTAKALEQEEFEKYWHEGSTFQPLGKDPYVRYFWPNCPSLEDTLPMIERCYGDYLKYREQVKS